MQIILFLPVVDTLLISYSNSCLNSFRWAVRICWVIVGRDMSNCSAKDVELMSRGCAK